MGFVMNVMFSIASTPTGILNATPGPGDGLLPDWSFEAHFPATVLPRGGWKKYKRRESCPHTSRNEGNGSISGA